jgi:hypothetical protein
VSKQIQVLEVKASGRIASFEPVQNHRTYTTTSAVFEDDLGTNFGIGNQLIQLLHSF